MRRAVQPRLSAESGFWKTIWIERLSVVGRLADFAGELVVVELDAAAGVGALDAQDRLGQGRLARARLADEPERLPVEQLEVDADQRRHIVPALVERLRYAVDRQRQVALRTAPGPTTAGGSTSSPSRSMWWQRRPPPVADVDHGRHDRPAQVGGELATVDEHAGRQRACRSGAGCRGSWRAAARTCGSPWRGSERSSPSVYGCWGRSKTVAASPSSTILPAYITPTRSHSVRMTPRLWAISRTAAFVSAWSDRTRSSTLASTVASSPVVGSSRTRSFGSEARAMAMTTRCCIPPESWCG